MLNDITLLDCTFRDGGYYNNWNFDHKIIQKYLIESKKLNINYIELGFRSLEKVKIKGVTGYTTDKFINSLKIPKNLNIGVMINASDILDKKDTIKECKKLFPKNISKIKFVRLACHLHEIFFLKDVVKWFKDNDYFVFVNLMQISEIKNEEIKRVCNYLSKTETNVLYLADSLGSLSPSKTKNIIIKFKEYWKRELGFHPHNNLKFALKNSIEAYRYGTKWIDCTIYGMGRGPGNLITQDILCFKNKNFRKKKIFSKYLKSYFLKLKKKYKWGPNIYYKIAAQNKIHPTYIQKILSDRRYKKFDYMNIINSLKKTETSKYNPTKHFKFVFFSKKPKFNKKNLIDLKKIEKVLILGPGESVKLNKLKIEKFITQKKLYVIALNSTNSINEKLISLRAACHPLRIISDLSIYKKLNTKLIIPYSSLNKSIKNSIDEANINYLNYGLELNLNKKIFFNKNYCSLPYPLVIGYVLSLLSNNSNNHLYMAGMDGFDLDNPDTDNSKEILVYFLNRVFKKKFISLTPNKHKELFKYQNI